MILDKATASIEALDALAKSDNLRMSQCVICRDAIQALKIMREIVDQTRVNSQDFASLPSHLAKLRLQLIWERIACTQFDKCEHCDSPLTADDIGGGRCIGCGRMICPKYEPFAKHQISPALRKFFQAEISNEDYDGARPATLDSAFGSFVDMQLDVLAEVTGGVLRVADRLALAHELDAIRRTESGQTMLKQLL